MSDDSKTADVIEEQSGTLMQQIVNEIIYSPLNLILIGIITFLIYQIFKTRHPKPSPPPEPEMPKLRKDFTVQELKAYDGTQPDGRVLVAVNGNVYDVTKGKRFYGPGKLPRLFCNHCCIEFFLHTFAYIVPTQLVFFLFLSLLSLSLHTSTTTSLNSSNRPVLLHFHYS